MTARSVTSLLKSALVPTAPDHFTNKLYVDGKVDKGLLDAKGDLIAATSDNTPGRVPVGADGTFLKADSTQTAGLTYGLPTKSDVGLGNVDNTSDSGKPVSTAQATALAAKAAGASGASVQVLNGTVVHTHPESPNFSNITHMFNDIAYNLLRGGSVVVTRNGTGEAPPASMGKAFEPDVGSAGFTMAAPTTDVLVLEVTFCRSFTFTTRFGVVFSQAFRAQDVTCEIYDSVAAQWISLGTSLNDTVGIASFTGNGGASGANPVTKMRLTLSDFSLAANNSLRITNIFALNYASTLARETFVDRMGGAIYGPITTTADPASANELSRKSYVDAGDTSAKARANHTGTQLAATISDFSTAADARITAAALVPQTRTINAKALSANVTLTQDDVASGTTNKAYTATEQTKLTGIATGATANSTDAILLARANHTGTQSADTLTDGTTNKAFLATERTKLTGIATGATANSTDATLLARANHTGTQSADTIVDGTTNKVFTATMSTKLAGLGTVRDVATTQSATPAINTDVTDQATITGLAQAITSMTSGLTGTPTNGQKLMIRFTDNGTARAIAWGTKFLPSGIAALLTTTVATKTHLVGFIYDSTKAAWMCVAVDTVGY